MRETEVAARRLGVKVQVRRSTQIQMRFADGLIATMSKQRADAIIVHTGCRCSSLIENELAELAAKHRLPSMCETRVWTEDGWPDELRTGPALILWRRAAAYVDRILKGAKPD